MLCIGIRITLVLLLRYNVRSNVIKKKIMREVTINATVFLFQFPIEKMKYLIFKFHRSAALKFSGKWGVLTLGSQVPSVCPAMYDSVKLK